MLALLLLWPSLLSVMELVTELMALISESGVGVQSSSVETSRLIDRFSGGTTTAGGFFGPRIGIASVLEQEADLLGFRSAGIDVSERTCDTADCLLSGDCSFVLGHVWLVRVDVLPDGGKEKPKKCER